MEPKTIKAWIRDDIPHGSKVKTDEHYDTFESRMYNTGVWKFEPMEKDGKIIKDWYTLPNRDKRISCLWNYHIS